MKNPTVFVLGAGASAPFGFPLGRNWSKEIYNGLSGSSQPLAEILRNTLGHDYAILERFHKEFYLSGKNSIDAFLEHRREYEQLGKAVIAATLIPHETDAVFGYAADNWLRYTYERLDTGFEEFGNNKVSFITFNYDRVIEWFFVTSLSNSYNKSKRDCVEVLKSIPIIHLHGRLGHLPWETSADRFGFHPTNVERLGLNNLRKKDKSLARLHQLAPIFAIFAGFCEGKPLELLGQSGRKRL